MSIGQIVGDLRDGAKYALAVGAAAATVGIVGVVTLTGVGFKISFIVTSTAADMAAWVGAFLPVGWTAPQTLTLLFTLIMTEVVCILMGCGIRDGQLHHYGDDLRAYSGPARRGADRGAFLRLLLRGSGGYHAAGSVGGLCRGRHGGATRSISAIPPSA